MNPKTLALIKVQKENRLRFCIYSFVLPTHQPNLSIGCSSFINEFNNFLSPIRSFPTRLEHSPKPNRLVRVRPRRKCHRRRRLRDFWSSSIQDNDDDAIFEPVFHSLLNRCGRRRRRDNRLLSALDSIAAVLEPVSGGETKKPDEYVNFLLKQIWFNGLQTAEIIPDCCCWWW